MIKKELVVKIKSQERYSKDMKDISKITCQKRSRPTCEEFLKHR